ncbi:MAG: hypothetical protein JNM56_23275 [Planctomycetia bacterium]|nr:hypothetical protein [Planctomycetia bacterium]
MFQTACTLGALLTLVSLLGTEGGQAAPPSANQLELKELLATASQYLQADVRNRNADPTPGRTDGNAAITKFVKGVGRLPEKDDIRRQAIALARKYASVADLRQTPDPGSIYHHQAHARLHFAWGVLLETGVLRAGLRLEEAAALLGEPTSVRDEMMEWYYNSLMQVNPCLRASLRDGQRLGEIKIIGK